MVSKVFSRAREVAIGARIRFKNLFPGKGHQSNPMTSIDVDGDAAINSGKQRGGAEFAGSNPKSILELPRQVAPKFRNGLGTISGLELFPFKRLDEICTNLSNVADFAVTSSKVVRSIVGKLMNPFS